MREIWLPVVGYEGLYEVSNWGRVKSLNYKNTHREKILIPWAKDDGYLMVRLYNKGKSKYRSIHQLVAEAFIPNPNGYTIVHHINHEDKISRQDNRVENLQWISKEDHDRLHAIDRAKGLVRKMGRTVYQYTLDWKLVKVWKTVGECGRNGFNQGAVCDCCNNKFHREGNNIYKGFRWSYELIINN